MPTHTHKKKYLIGCTPYTTQHNNQKKKNNTEKKLVTKSNKIFVQQGNKKFYWLQPLRTKIKFRWVNMHNIVHIKKFNNEKKHNPRYHL
jgi:acyl CoA:acetate/3-ketoacid CoA transferase beta subunit